MDEHTSHELAYKKGYEQGKQDAQKWISVKDRLPEEDDSIHFYGDGRMRCTTVLAYTEYGRIIPKNRLIVKPTGNEYLDTQVTDGWEWARGTEEVTHWMPLPQPPKGE